MTARTWSPALALAALVGLSVAAWADGPFQPVPSPSPSASASPRVFTEEDLKKAGGRVESATVKGSPAPRASASPAGDEEESGQAVTDPKQAEAMWRARAADARKAVERAEADLKRAEAERDAVGTQPNPMQMQGTGDPWAAHQAQAQAAESALENARANLEAAKAAFSALEDEARRAGALPGWLR